MQIEDRKSALGGGSAPFRGLVECFSHFCEIRRGHISLVRDEVLKIKWAHLSVPL